MALDYLFGNSYSPQQLTQNLNNRNQFSSSIIWVQGEVGAKAYPIAPGNSLILMDSESNKFYIKSVDFSGKPSIKSYTYTEDSVEEKAKEPAPEYVTKEEFLELKKTIDELMS